MAKKPVFEIADLYKLRGVSDPQMAPDGHRVAYVEERIDREARKYLTTLSVVDSTGGKPRRLTSGKRSDSLPRWSPDGAQLAFVRREDLSAQVCLLDMAGGEARTLTELPRGGVSQIEWSPDGKRIAFVFRAMSSNVPVDKDGKAEAPVYRHIKRLYYRLDGDGYFDEQVTHVWVVDVASGKTVQLSDGPYHHRRLAWSPDGKTIACIGNRRDDWDYHVEEEEIYLVPAAGGAMKAVASLVGPKVGLAWSPDGQDLAFIGHAHPYGPWGVANMRLWLVPARGGKARCLTPELDSTLFPCTLGDSSPSLLELSPLWAPDGKHILVVATSRGGGPVLSVSRDGRKIETVVGNDHTVLGLSLDATGTRLAFHAGRLDRPDEIYLLDLKARGTRPRRLTNEGGWIATREATPTEEFTVVNDGAEIAGFIQKPPAFNPRKKYPAILYIHGGPRCQYGRLHFHEMHVLAAAGYVVIYTNPRGSQGYGEDFAGAISACWAEPAMADLMAALDHVVARGYIDAKRLGVAGGSYGGYMVNWIVSHSHRFAAAITERSVVDLRSMAGTSDFGFGVEWEFRTNPWKDDAAYRKWSPLSYVHNIRTPLLITHQENDLRCNIEQADQLYMALKHARKTVEYVRFPEESHGLSRHGRPDRRAARLTLIREWFDRYLK